MGSCRVAGKETKKQSSKASQTKSKELRYMGDNIRREGRTLVVLRQWQGTSLQQQRWPEGLGFLPPLQQMPCKKWMMFWRVRGAIQDSNRDMNI